MKIAIDARYIKTTSEEVRPDGGIGRYTYNLILQLSTLTDDLELLLIVPPGNRRPILKEPAIPVEEIRCSGRPHSLKTQFFLAQQTDLSGIDLFHSPFNMLPCFLRCRSVVTIHDLMWVTKPSLCARFLPERLWIGARYRIAIDHALLQADHVITISHASKGAITTYRPSSADKTTAIHHGTEPLFFEIPQHEAWQEIGTLVPRGCRFVLSIGQGSPYKNHAQALRAFALAFADKPEMKLVLVRRFKRLDFEVLGLLQRPDLRGRVICLPSVTESQVRALYNLARMFFFPSLAEGFGMPVLESMACGTPVLTSTTSVLPEIAGDAALLADPHDVHSLARGLVMLENDEKLRYELVARGKRRIRQFTWQRCALETLAVYQKVCTGD